MGGRLVAAFVMASACAVEVSAQVTGRPPRAAAERSGPRTTGGLFGGQRRPDSGRTPHKFSFTLDMLTGYEDNVTPDQEGVPTNPTAAPQSATSAVLSAILEFERTSPTSGFEASARTVGAAYQGVGVRPSLGGRANARAFRRLFSRVTFSGWAEVDYQPTFILDGTPGSPIGPDDVTAPQDLTGGVTEVKSTNVSAGGSGSIDFSARQHSALSYIRSRLRSTTFNDVAQVSQTATVSHRWNFARNLGLSGSYSRSQQTGDGGAESSATSELNTQAAALGLEIRVPVSRSRQLSFTVEGGATLVDTTNSVDGSPVDYVTPSGSATARLDLGRTWAVTAQFHRVVTSLEGLTRQSFVTTSGTYWIGGNIGRRSLVSVNGNFSSGAPHEGDTGSFQSLGTTAQVQYAVSQCCSVVTSYSYYQHKVRDVAAVPIGFPSTIDRSALRVGLSFWLPLHGTFPASGR